LGFLLTRRLPRKNGGGVRLCATHHFCTQPNLGRFTCGLDLNCKDKLNEWMAGTIKLRFK